MFRKYFLNLKYFDWVLFLSVMLLLGFSLAALYGIAESFEKPNFINFQKQIAFGVIGVGLLFVMSFLNYNFFKSHAFLLYIIVLLLLIYVLFFGIIQHGTKGWLRLYNFNFQPVELAKFGLLIILSKIYSSHGNEPKDLKFIFKTGFLTFFYFFVVFLQPDLGSSLLLFLLWFGMLIFSNAKKIYLLYLIIIFAVLFTASWVFLFQDYQKGRITTFFQPMSDPLGAGYHVRQSVIAIGSGNFFGKGWASGSQSQLKFIPASQTDFIFAVISEELGFFGSFLILFLYSAIFYRILRIARKARDEFGARIITGISIIFFTQIVINIGMNLGIMPVTGIGLPFLSYGGSFLVISLVFIGFIECVAIRSTKYRI